MCITELVKFFTVVECKVLEIHITLLYKSVENCRNKIYNFDVIQIYEQSSYKEHQTQWPICEDVELRNVIINRIHNGYYKKEIEKIFIN